MKQSVFQRFSDWTQNIDGGWMHTFRMLMLAILPASGAGFIVYLIYDTFDWKASNRNETIDVYLLFGSIVFAPVVETALMFPLIRFIQSFSNNKLIISCISGLIWGVFHVIVKGWIAILTSWPFFVFTLLLLAWKPISNRMAYVHVVTCHVLYNTLLFLFLSLID